MTLAQRIDRRAEKRLQSIGSQFETVLGPGTATDSNTGLHIELKLKSCNYVRELALEYDLQNRFFSRIYDLKIKCSLPFDHGEETRISLNYGGFNSIKNARFVAEPGSEVGSRIAAKLNNPRVTRKFLEFQFLGLNLEYRVEKKTWNIEATSMVGSSTWMFLPPILHTIKPKPEECSKIVNLFELLAFVVSTEESISI